MDLGLIKYYEIISLKVSNQYLWKKNFSIVLMRSAISRLQPTTVFKMIFLKRIHSEENLIGI